MKIKIQIGLQYMQFFRIEFFPDIILGYLQVRLICGKLESSKAGTPRISGRQSA